MTTLLNYVVGMWMVCTHSWFNASQCVRVWEYMPAYVNDYAQFVQFEPYYAEKQALKK